MARNADLTDAQRAIVQKNCLRFREELARDLGEDISQQSIAEMCGLSLEAVRGYEQGRRVPDVHSMLRLGQVYGRAVEDFFLENPPPPDPAKRIAVRAKIIGPLAPDLRDKVMDFLAGINREHLDRVRAIKEKQRRKGR